MIMRTIAVVAAALVLELTAVHAQGPRLAGTYNSICRYECCDKQHNCAVAHFFMGAIVLGATRPAILTMSALEKDRSVGPVVSHVERTAASRAKMAAGGTG
jgi:hypothetical protein